LQRLGLNLAALYLIKFEIFEAAKNSKFLKIKFNKIVNLTLKLFYKSINLRIYSKLNLKQSASHYQ